MSPYVTSMFTLIYASGRSTIKRSKAAAKRFAAQVKAAGEKGEPTQFKKVMSTFTDGNESDYLPSDYDEVSDGHVSDYDTVHYGSASDNDYTDDEDDESECMLNFNSNLRTFHMSSAQGQQTNKAEPLKRMNWQGSGCSARTMRRRRAA